MFACAERETLEETGLNIRAIKIVAVTNDVFAKENKHYVSIFMKCERIDPQQQPQVRIDIVWDEAWLTGFFLDRHWSQTNAKDGPGKVGRTSRHWLIMRASLKRYFCRFGI